MARMDNPANTLLNMIWKQGDAFDEWWATDKPNEFVICADNPYLHDIAFRVTVEAIPVPPISPSGWEEGEGPHPYGWKE